MTTYKKSLFLIGFLALVAAVVRATDEPASAGFNPRVYSMSHATCKGMNRAKQQTVDIDLGMRLSFFGFRPVAFAFAAISSSNHGRIAL